MGKKYDELKERFTWKSIDDIGELPNSYLELILLKLKNGNIFLGCRIPNGIYVAYDVAQSKYLREISKENPVIEWCYLPFERES